MTVKAIKSFLLSSLVVITFISCDPSETIHFKLNNNSDYSVKVYYRNYKMMDRNETVNSKSESEFYQQEQIGFGHDYGDSFLNCLDSISFTVTGDTMRVLKDYLKRVNWEFKVVDPTVSINEIEYKLILNNNDIEKIK